MSVDTGTCDECLSEVTDPANRRHDYPFTNCTNCGPRYTIVLSVPYDRAATTMAGFTMCEACQAEYDDPGDRRFDAQPNACPVCGPQLRYCRPGGELVGEGPAALPLAVEALAAGAVLAVKGLGGYHLAADATNAGAVATLRRRKAARRQALRTDGSRRGVRPPSRRTRRGRRGGAGLDPAPDRAGAAPADATIADAVAPGLSELGVMLAYTPLHHLLMAALGRPLVLTSGNLSDEPIAYQDDDAVRRLGPLVDAVLTHDRPIHIRCDDSVVRATPEGIQVLRRSRGFAPEPMALPFAARRQVLGVGAELKNTVTLAKGRAVVASHHIGDLEHLPAYEAFLQAIDHLCRLYGVTPEVVAHDLHPEYLSTKLAGELDLPALGVQHHHAHVASCLVDHQRTGPVLGVAFDGHGFGPDGTLWGGEFLIADLDGFNASGICWPSPARWDRRHPGTVAHGGDLGPAGGRTGAGRRDRCRHGLPAGAVLDLAASPSTIRTTSVGRLFDAVAALLGGRTRVTYEGQAAIELEALAGPVPAGAAQRYPVEQRWEDGQLVLDPSPLIAALMELTPGAPAAAAFHESFGQATAEAAAGIARGRGLATVALTGGVFQNARLTRIVATALRAQGCEVLLHRSVPPGDGGISVGQAAVAAHRLE